MQHRLILRDAIFTAFPVYCSFKEPTALMIYLSIPEIEREISSATSHVLLNLVPSFSTKLSSLSTINDTCCRFIIFLLVFSVDFQRPQLSAFESLYFVYSHVTKNVLAFIFIMSLVHIFTFLLNSYNSDVSINHLSF